MKTGVFALLALVTIVIGTACRKDKTGDPVSADISNTRWDVSINNMHALEFQVGPIRNYEVTVTRVSDKKKLSGPGIYLGNKLSFEFTDGARTVSVSGIVAGDGRTMTGNLQSTDKKLGQVVQEFTAARK